MDTVIYEIKDRIAYVTINRPEAYNACNIATYIRLAEIWRDYRENDDAWIAILTGAGEKAFCAGSDIKQNYDDAPTPSPSEAFAEKRTPKWQAR
jgi:enoyl-CoA hydratase/carnithine racemase